MSMTELAAKFLVFTLLAASVGCDNKKDPPGATTKAAASTAASTSAIPTTPLSGKLGDQPFNLKKATIVTAKGFGEWRMSLEGETAGGQAAAIRLPLRGALAVGKTIES